MPIPSRNAILSSKPSTEEPSALRVDPQAQLPFAERGLEKAIHILAMKTEDEWLAAASRKSLRSFMHRMYPNYRSSRHIDRLIAALEMAITIPNYRLLIDMPPRHSKSLHVSEHLPAFYLGNNPDKRVITASHTADLAFTFSRRVRNKMMDPKWPFDHVTVAGDKSAVKAWDIAGHLGGYMAVGVGGSPAGHGGNLIIVDDPIGSQADAESEAVREALWEWYQGTLRDRLEPGGSMIVTATRWHEDDLTGHLLAEMRNGGEIWNHLHMPALNQNGEALWPERWPVEDLRRIRKAVGSRIWEARFQGNPTPLEGGLIKRHWWNFYKGDPREVSKKLKGHIQSWDMAFRETKSGSYIVGQLWAIANGAEYYLLDQVRFRGDFVVTKAEVQNFTRKWPMAKLKLVEDKANGPAIVSSLREEISGLIEVNPRGGKLARASAIAPIVESGNVYLPDPDVYPWVHDFIEECAAFPHGSNDDQVDCMSQALMRLEVHSIPKSQPSAFSRGSSSMSPVQRSGGLNRRSFLTSTARRFAVRR